jgi:putative RNA 2'-phosphotransferase
MFKVKPMNDVSLSKWLSHALRHEPWLYELELDEEGWVSTKDVLTALRSGHREWEHLTEADLMRVISTSSKRRHELIDGRVRALYGHSLTGKLKKQSASPPDVLFHGTSPTSLHLIRKSGLLPMGRQYIHLSIDEATAVQVGCRKSNEPIVLLVSAKCASRAGVEFYEGNDRVWLADNIPSRFIAFGECAATKLA